MSIYSEHELGYITDSEFNSAAYREYAGDNDYDEDEAEEECVITAKEIQKCLVFRFCGQCDKGDCEGCLVNVAYRSVEGGKL